MIKMIISNVISIISRLFIILKINSRIINQLNKLRSESHKIENYKNIILKLLGNNKLVALDVGAQGGFFNGSIFSKKYNIFS